MEKLHNKEICDLYYSPRVMRMIKSRRMRWGNHVERIVAKMDSYRILVGKPEGKRPLGGPRRMCVDNIKIDLGGIDWGDFDCISLAQDRDK
jgi:hypothetical protein